MGVKVEGKENAGVNASHPVHVRRMKPEGNVGKKNS